ncbi:tyrosine-type recombinase/integrase [Bailinhaonella thermotolerans]|uniref:Site-specific integrase n=1 Tax=Bailinhaonella thermotolerans TaxID=1070861 RepID=A0A3A4ARQ7_9ACTN|nr:tyrosine-type recombinase/integrase [Bailinhaonella thermotolerans]RJL29954.1 site-specific integrase [Bailinhaonella thermotolerans]
MTKRRSRGEGGLHWDPKRQRWIASVTIGYTPAGKRIVKRGSGRTKTEAKNKLKDVLRDHEDGLAIAPTDYTVKDAVTYWLANGLRGRSSSTIEMYVWYANKHVIPAIGARKLRELSVEDVDQWLSRKTSELGTRSLKLIHNLLDRSVRNAMVRDKVKRNIVALCEVPEGRVGRPSKALTLDQAETVLKAAESATPRIRAYIVVSLLTGARTEELRDLRWDHVVAYEEQSSTWRPVTQIGWEHEQFAIYVWRSVRQSGDTKTVRSRRSLRIPARCVRALRLLMREHEEVYADGPLDDRRVFGTRNDTAMTAENVRRDFRLAIKDAEGIDAKDWTPRELRHSFVSLLSAHDVPIEHISRLVGHTNTVVTETVYRKQIRPVMQEGATVMDRIFPLSLDP